MADDRGPQLMGVLVALFVTSAISGALRFYTHGVIIKRFFAEDHVTIVALLLYVAYTIVGVLGVTHGLGKHTVHVPAADRPAAIMYRWLASLFYIVISLLTKWIVGLFLLRICPHRRWRQVTIWTILASVTVFSILYFFFDLFACQPIQYQWLRYDADADPADGTCNATTFATVTSYIAAVLNIVADWALPALPATLVWKSQIERRMKVSIIALLCLGSTASIATIVRIPYADGILDNPDYLYTFTDLGIWSTVEIGVALTASNLATLKPLLRKLRVFDSISGITQYGSKSRHATGGANAASGRSAASRSKSFVSGNNHIVITGAASSHDPRGHRWSLRESMELELVDRREGTGGESKSDLDKSP
ncbi:cation-transporting ATPase 4 [Metarhizium album ARSEF 1941]|uniref:Cation-transporting ATPase 4 n=1 Tax=Metarhizium album (strain ARSEF 1941) TaxID=1081103 RepID=A0A0B2WRD1_METAS|nr:cation-transporting ATPase 4 [Metarhizium album ARSEF 1941]KHN96057.1 cation-transporting ATPase 4 [Metarhizium album ARSEF 1941]